MNKGFSLVELIVVIAIMAILVGVAVPVYTGYINKAEDAKVTQYKEELERALNTVYIEAISGMTEGLETPDELSVTNAGLVATVGDQDTPCPNFVAAVNAIVAVDANVAVTITINSNGTITVA